MARLHAVTGALGYSGRAVAERLLAQGERVRTLTNSPGRPNPFGDVLEVSPLAFDRPGELAASLAGVDTLINTYWVRFNHRRFTHEGAVANTKTLFEAARRASVRRVVHVSILNPDGGPGFSYYRGKAELERTLRESGIEHAVVRPGVLFGRGDILVNNIAWVLRTLPVFGVFGDGRYALRPMHVDDFAALVVRTIDDEPGTVVDAVGPERFEYRGLVRMLAGAIGVRRPIVRVPAWAGLATARALGPALRDVVLTRGEIGALMKGLLDSAAESTGTTRLSDWARAHADSLGRRYASELGRRTDLAAGYTSPAGA